jgi:hypothetical protein
MRHTHNQVYVKTASVQTTIDDIHIISTAYPLEPGPCLRQDVLIVLMSFSALLERSKGLRALLSRPHATQTKMP